MIVQKMLQDGERDLFILVSSYCLGRIGLPQLGLGGGREGVKLQLDWHCHLVTVLPKTFQTSRARLRVCARVCARMSDWFRFLLSSSKHAFVANSCMRTGGRVSTRKMRMIDMRHQFLHRPEALVTPTPLTLLRPRVLVLDRG